MQPVSIVRLGRFLNRVVDLFERPHLDLADALAGDTELLCEVFKCFRVFSKAPGFENPPLAVVELAKRLLEVISTLGEFLGFAEGFLL